VWESGGRSIDLTGVTDFVRKTRVANQCEKLAALFREAPISPPMNEVSST
jgi:hypothetical protein